MSEIQSLTSQVQQLEKSVTFWTNLYLLAGAIAVIVGVAAVTFQFTSHLRSTRLNEVQGRLIRAKDDKLAIDLGDKDIEIGGLKRGAASLTAKNLELEAAIAPRRLSERQQIELATLTAFANHTVGLKSYSSDTEGLILATQIMDALSKSKISIEDNRLTMQPAGSVTFGVSVDGPDKALVAELTKILFRDGRLIKASSVMPSPNRSGVSIAVTFGRVTGGTPPAATITVGAKPIK